MWNSFGHYLHQASRPSTPKSLPSPSSYDQKTLSPRVRFPHIYSNNNLDPLSLQFPQSASPRYGNYTDHVCCGSPAYAFPYRMGNPWPPNDNSSPETHPSPPGVHPHQLNVGRHFGLVPATRRTRVVEEDGGHGWWPTTVESVDAYSHKTRGIGHGPAEEEAQPRMERFKIRTVDIDEMLVQQEDK